MDEQWRGPLYPTRLPEFHRLPPPPPLEDRVHWFWIPEWDIAPGRTSRQEILPFPSLNLVIEADHVILAGPATRRVFRELRGRGWAVGMLLRPAAVPGLRRPPASLRDTEVALDAPELHASVAAAMSSPVEGARRRGLAVEAAAGWLAAQLPAPDPEGRLANSFDELARSDSSLTRVAQAAESLGVSVRTLQRIARRHIGLPPLTVIRRYRLQDAVERLRRAEGTTIAEIAAELGYADHAHLAATFREVLGVTPSGYRQTSTTERRVARESETVRLSAASGSPSGREQRPARPDTPSPR